jgi:hypothetical protein
MDHPPGPDRREGLVVRDAVRQITDMMFRYAELFDTGRFDEFAALLLRVLEGMRTDR